MNQPNMQETVQIDRHTGMGKQPFGAPNQPESIESLQSLGILVNVALGTVDGPDGPTTFIFVSGAKGHDEVLVAYYAPPL